MCCLCCVVLCCSRPRLAVLSHLQPSAFCSAHTAIQPYRASIRIGCSSYSTARSIHPIAQAETDSHYFCCHSQHSSLLYPRSLRQPLSVDTTHKHRTHHTQLQHTSTRVCPLLKLLINQPHTAHTPSPVLPHISLSLPLPLQRRSILLGLLIAAVAPSLSTSPSTFTAFVPARCIAHKRALNGISGEWCNPSHRFPCPPLLCATMTDLAC